MMVVRYLVMCLVLGGGCFLIAAEPEKKDPPSKGDDALREALEYLNKFSSALEKIKEAEARKKCADELNKLGTTIHNAQSTSPLGPYDATNPSWSSYILPYIELPAATRFGADLEPVNDSLRRHLDLPKDSGVLIRQVPKDSDAEESGFKANDIVLEIGDKKVPSNLEALEKILADIKVDAPTDVVVLRQGKKTTLKEVKFGKPRVNNQYYYRPWTMPQYSPNFPYRLAPITDGTSSTITLNERLAHPVPSIASTMISTHRQEDRFTTRYQEGSLIITITGKMVATKGTVGQIKVQDGTIENRYASLEKVPVEYQDKVRDLIPLAEQGHYPIELKR